MFPPQRQPKAKSARNGVRTQTSELNRRTQSQNSTLELKPHPELEEARCFAWGVAGNCSEERISHGRIRLPKARVIGEVKYLRPHFQPHAFLGHKRLVKVQIRVVDAVDPQARKIARRVTRILIARVSEAPRVEVGRGGRPRTRVRPLQSHIVHGGTGGPKLGTDNLGPLGAVSEARVRHAEGHRLSR